MKIIKIVTVAVFALCVSAAQGEYRQVNMTVFGMDCAPCAHAIHVSMKGIKGVDTVEVNLNTGLVQITLTPGNSADMRQFNAAVKENGFTYKGANVVVRGQIAGSASAPFLEVTGTQDRYALTPLASGADISSLVGKTVTVEGTIPPLKGKTPDTLHYKTIEEAQ